MSGRDPTACIAVAEYAYHAAAHVLSFEWDHTKEARNIGKHGVDFDEASTTFYDEGGMEMLDEEHSAREERWLRLAMSLHGRLLVTVFVERGDRIRIISSRPANRREVRVYERGL